VAVADPERLAAAHHLLAVPILAGIPNRAPSDNVFTTLFGFLEGTSGNLLWKWGAEKIHAGEAINAKLSGDSGRFSNEDSGDFIKLQPA
jgi:hypothetical protein